jgi:hypothetical protein
VQFKCATPEEKAASFEMFKATLKEIDYRNALSRTYNGSAVFGINDLADRKHPCNHVVMSGIHPHPKLSEDETVSARNVPAIEALKTVPPTSKR